MDTDVRALCFDRAGRLWIGTIGSGLFVRKQDGIIVRVLDPNEPDRRVMRAIAMTRNGDLWIGTHAGLIRLSHTGMDFLRVANSASSDFGSVFVDRDDSVWLSAGSLSHYAGGKERTIELGALRGERIRGVYRDSSGDLWVGDGWKWGIPPRAWQSSCTRARINRYHWFPRSTRRLDLDWG
jgi:ligand-binding sensor domain-containing protein